jgi:hypothetical protein
VTQPSRATAVLILATPELINLRRVDDRIAVALDSNRAKRREVSDSFQASGTLPSLVWTAQQKRGACMTPR